MNARSVFFLALIALSIPVTARARTIVLTDRLHHLRVTEAREWSDFPAKPESPRLARSFQATRNDAEWSLRLRQQDVKQTWKVLLNGKELARLLPDENDTIVYFPVVAGALVTGENTLVIEQVGKTPDDIRVGEITLDDRPVAQALSEATVEVTVREAGQPGEPKPVPCRITILNHQGALMTTGAASSDRLAVRPGVVYTSDGTARFGLPAGDYTLHAGRGFAYSIDTTRVSLRAGETVRRSLTIRREVPTEGWVSCDTHVHTLTHSGHGDSTIDERMVTIAGEDIDLPIATDHNKQIDYHDLAVKRGVRNYFTPVTGNEVTTNFGHFNIFPVKAGGPLPNHEGKEWSTIFKSIAERTAAPIIILNHPRDKHAGFRPFGPEHHLALTGENLDGWELRANALEVVNSGAQQTDMLRLYHDWFGLLNRGHFLTPIGSSDSHDVSRFIIGQGRTYIRSKAKQPGAIDVEEAVSSLREGRVLVSCGLLAEITVNDRYGPGDLAPAKGDVKVAVRVRGPGWTTADRVELYANGIKIREAAIQDGRKAGIKWEGEWVLPAFRHDVFLVAVATGPGVRALHWPIAKPYQPTSPVAEPRVIGSTGAVWLDADGDGKRTSAHAYAERVLRDAGGDWRKAIAALSEYPDEGVAAQAAGLLRVRGVVIDDAVREAARKAGSQVERAFEAYAEAWRQSQIARAEMR
jgi:hypothetical protein